MVPHVREGEPADRGDIRIASETYVPRDNPREVAVIHSISCRSWCFAQKLEHLSFNLHSCFYDITTPTAVDVSDRELAGRCVPL